MKIKNNIKRETQIFFEEKLKVDESYGDRKFIYLVLSELNNINNDYSRIDKLSCEFELSPEIIMLIVKEINQN